MLKIMLIYLAGMVSSPFVMYNTTYHLRLRKIKKPKSIDMKIAESAAKKSAVVGFLLSPGWPCVWIASLYALCKY